MTSTVSSGAKGQKGQATIFQDVRHAQLKASCQEMMDVWLEILFDVCILRRLCRHQCLESVSKASEVKPSLWDSVLKPPLLHYINCSWSSTGLQHVFTSCSSSLNLTLTLCVEALSVQAFPYFASLGLILVPLTFFWHGGKNPPSTPSTAAVCWNESCSMPACHNTSSHYGL